MTKDYMEFMKYLLLGKFIATAMSVAIVLQWSLSTDRPSQMFSPWLVYFSMTLRMPLTLEHPLCDGLESKPLAGANSISAQTKTRAPSLHGTLPACWLIHCIKRRAQLKPQASAFAGHHVSVSTSLQLSISKSVSHVLNRRSNRRSS